MTQKIFAGATFIPIMLGLLWRKSNTNGAISGMVLGGSATVICQILGTDVDPVIVGIIFSLVGTIGVSLLVKEENEKGELFQVKTVTNKDVIFLSVILAGYILFLVGTNFVNVWSVLIIATLLGLTIGVVLLIAYMLPKPNKTQK